MGDLQISMSPVLSSTASIVSFDSTFPETSESYQSHLQMPSEDPELPSADLGAQHHGERKTHRGEHATPDDSSIVRHDEYFFEDGNVTFLVGGTLYCVHRYLFRNSVHFSTRFSKLGVRDHEALPTIISMGDVERNDFEALLSVLYPRDIGEYELTYEQWKSVLHLSTRWGFATLRKLTLNSIKPPTPHDQLVLARTYSVDEWVLPALTALCERKLPLSLDEAREMSLEDVILVVTVREEIRGGALRVDAADIPRYIKAAKTEKENRNRSASEVDPNTMGAEVAKIKSGPQQMATKEGDTDESDVGHASKVESPGAEQPHVVEGTPRGCLEKTVAVPVGKTTSLEEASPEPVARPLNVEGLLAENHVAEALDTEVAGKMNAEIMRLLDDEDRAYAEETRKEQEEATRAKERADAEALARADVEEKARKKHEEFVRAKAIADAAKKAAKKERKALRETAKRESASKDK